MLQTDSFGHKFTKLNFRGTHVRECTLAFPRFRLVNFCLKNASLNYVYRRPTVRRCSILIGLFLSGCGTYNTKFDCPAGKGLSCTALSKVNKMIDRGEVGKKEVKQTSVSDSADSPLEVYLPPHVNEKGQFIPSSTLKLPQAGNA